MQEYQTIVDGYTNAGIPLETFVSDSQYMDHDQDFTLGAKFPLADMQAFVAGLHSKGQRWVRSTLILLPPHDHACILISHELQPVLLPQPGFHPEQQAPSGRHAVLCGWPAQQGPLP